MDSQQQLLLGCQIAWLRSHGLRWKEVAQVIENETGKRYCRTRLWMLETAAKKQVHEPLTNGVEASAA